MTQVLDELGLQLTENLNGVAVPSGSLSVATTAGKKAVAAGGEAAGGAAGGATDADADLQARLDDLRRE